MKKLSCISIGIVAILSAAAAPFPADKMTGSWRMSKIYSIEVDSGDGMPATETEQRLALTLTFLGGGKCRVVESHSALKEESATDYDFEYRDGVIVFTNIKGKDIPDLKDKMLGVFVKASRCELIGLGDNAFEMRYSDLSTLAKNWAAVGTATTEYLKGGVLLAKTTMHAGVLAIQMTERHPPMVFKRMTTAASASGSARAPNYRLRAFKRGGDGDFSYRFKLEFSGKAKVSGEVLDALLRDFKIAIIEDYSESFSDIDISTLFVDFTKCEQRDGMLDAEAEVLSIAVISFSYSAQTRRGQMTVKFGSDHLEEARQYVRRNISAIVRDKNIALVTGEVPPEAAVSIEREEVKNEGTFEIFFRAVE